MKRVGRGHGAAARRSPTVTPPFIPFGPRRSAPAPTAGSSCTGGPRSPPIKQRCTSARLGCSLEGVWRSFAHPDREKQSQIRRQTSECAFGINGSLQRITAPAFLSGNDLCSTEPRTAKPRGCSFTGSHATFICLLIIFRHPVSGIGAFDSHFYGSLFRECYTSQEKLCLAAVTENKTIPSVLIRNDALLKTKLDESGGE